MYLPGPTVYFHQMNCIFNQQEKTFSINMSVEEHNAVVMCSLKHDYCEYISDFIQRQLHTPAFSSRLTQP